MYNYDARLYDPIIGRFLSADSVMPDWYNPQGLNRYSYVLNNPLIYLDPNGHNWFPFEGSWFWFDEDEHTFTNSERKQETIKSSYEMLVTYEISGTNKEGAIAGSMTVYGEGYGDVKASSTGVFSGGNGFKPIGEGDYYMDLSERDTPLSLVKTGKDYLGNDIWETASIQKGIQYFPKGIIDFGGKSWNVGNEWGEGRIRLYPSRNLYIHGKFFSKNWTHGCVCDKSEKVFSYLWNSQYKGVVPFNVKY